MWVCGWAQLTGLCPLNHLSVSLVVVVLELAISTVLSSQQTPGTRLCRILEACCCVQLSCRCWRSKFRAICSCSKILPHWAAFPGPQATDRGEWMERLSTGFPGVLTGLRGAACSTAGAVHCVCAFSFLRVIYYLRLCCIIKWDIIFFSNSFQLKDFSLVIIILVPFLMYTKNVRYELSIYQTL